MSYNLDSIIPLKRIDELTQAYEYLAALKVDSAALLHSYIRFKDLASKSICLNERNKEASVLSFKYRELSSEKAVDCVADFSFTKQHHFNLNIIKDGLNDHVVEEYVKSLIMQIVTNNIKGSYKLCFIDVKNAGASFGNLINIANSDYKNFFGKIFINNNDITTAFTTLEKDISDNIAKSATFSESVFAYNETSDNPIPITFLVIFDCDKLNNTQKSTLEHIEYTAQKGGVNIIKISEENSSTEQSFNLKIEETQSLLSKGDFSACVEPIKVPYTAEDIEKACEKQQVNTLAESYFDLQNITFNMDSTDVLSIPFAIDEYGAVQSFEIGGYAPPHALISGMTGSGKSVLLHTIIDSISIHYHPNDVEIWAIDYKAVEFACYVENRSPHISVIGQDKSDDFSYSLLELINKEYERRKKLFVRLGVNNFKDCRARGEAISRLVIVIDEFHNLTQAVQQRPEYKVLLENLLSEMRAMGMSFIFCSQTISSGLMGLTEKGRNQIGCRLCMKQSSIDEIKATLADTMSATSDYIQNVKNFGIGQVLYKKSEEQGYTYHYLHVLYMNDEGREQLIKTINSAIGDDYIKRHEIICKNSERFDISEKKRHTLNLFLDGAAFPEPDEGIRFYPAAPTTLEEEFSIEFERAPGNNMIICIEEDELRESIELFTVMSLLANPNNVVNVSIFDAENNDCVRLHKRLSQLSSQRLNVYFGAQNSLSHMMSLKKLKPIGTANQIELLYGINKIKSAIYILSQHEE